MCVCVVFFSYMCMVVLPPYKQVFVYVSLVQHVPSKPNVYGHIKVFSFSWHLLHVCGYLYI